jgi:hypothetical protein
MRAFAITGMETVSMIFKINSGSLIRATPPCARISAGTRSNAITATARFFCDLGVFGRYYVHDHAAF